MFLQQFDGELHGLYKLKEGLVLFGINKVYNGPSMYTWKYSIRNVETGVQYMNEKGYYNGKESFVNPRETFDQAGSSQGTTSSIQTQTAVAPLSTSSEEYSAGSENALLAGTEGASVGLVSTDVLIIAAAVFGGLVILAITIIKVFRGGKKKKNTGLGMVSIDALNVK